MARAGGVQLVTRAAAWASAVALTAGVLTAWAAVPASAGAGPRPRVPLGPAGKDFRRLGVHKVRYRDVTAANARPSGVAWPGPRSAVASISPPSFSPTAHSQPPASALLFGTGGARAAAPGTPVWAQAPRVAGERAAKVAVRVLSHSAAVAAGVQGVLFTAASSVSQPTRVGVDYATFADKFGGNYGLSLQLVKLPACALTTPKRPACRRQTRLTSVNDAALQSVSAQLTLPSMAGSPGQIVTTAAMTPAATAPTNVVLAATSVTTDGGGPAGTYSATTLKPSGTWTAGGSNGSFDYRYPIPVPPAASSLVPNLSLSYQSGSTDGQTASTQAQASWAGDGWQTPQGFIEQSFTPCQDSPEGSASPQSTQDDCYDGPIFTMSLSGSSTPLVCSVPFSYTANSTCKPSADDGAIISHVVSSGNGSGTKFTDYWTVTERDGTTYYFGRNELPGWVSGDQATNSVDSVPVFSAHSGDPCYSSSGFSASVCTMAYRWNLDYVTDDHGNAMAYYYGQSQNAYARYGSSSAVSYVRDSYLDHIDYGFTAGNAYSGHAPDQITFATGDRCFTGTCDPLNSTNAANWLDVPYSDNCAAGSTSCANKGPTFWSTVRLKTITTKQWNGSAYATVDSWALSESMPPTGDKTSPTLFLDSIARTGSDTSAGGSAVSLPTVSFIGEQLGDRLNPGNEPALDRYRIQEITTETGSQILVSYEQTNPCSVSSPPTPSSNTDSCFPVYWQNFQPPTPDWFVKYAVQSVNVTDPTGGAPGTYTSYQYNNPAWHYDDNEVVKAKYRTYGQFRGYQDVKTFTGTGTDAQTESETTYYQGMSDDNNTTAVSLTDSQGSQHDDTNQLAGEPLEATQYVYANGPVDNSQITSYWVSAAAASRNRTGLPALTANFTGQVEKWTRQALTDSGSRTWRKTETDTSYDATPSDTRFGLPLEVFAHGDLSQPSQQTCTTTTYSAPNTGNNLVGLAAETEADAAPCGGPNPAGASAPTSAEINALTPPAGLSRPANVISDTRTYYDDPPVLSGGVAVPSNAAWPQAAPGNSDPSVVEKATNYTGGAFTYMTSSATAYDSDGRPVTSYDGNGNATTTAYTMTNGVTTLQTVTNPLGQATKTTYDPLRGLPTSVTDANGNTSTLHYDGIGRLIDVWQYGRPTSSPANYIYSYAVSNSAPTVVTTQKLNEASGYVTSTTLYDSLLRERQTQVPTPQGGILVSDNLYDSHGWLTKVNTNYWDSTASPGSGIIPVPDSQEPDQTVTTFDGLGRAVLVTHYDDSQVKSITETAYYGDRVTTAQTGPSLSDVLPGPASTVTDALGRTTEIDQYTSAPTVTTGVSGGFTAVSISGGTTQATDYSYNTRGEQSNVAAGGENWQTGYNLLGQVTSKTDPDAGTSTTTYDNNGNVMSTTDAEGHTVSYTYDAENRKTGEYDGPTSASPPIATWAYDNSNNALPGIADPIGHMTTQTSYTNGSAYIVQQKGFNAWGESLGENVTLPVAEGALAGTYSLTNTYTPVTGLPYRSYYQASPGGGALPAEAVTYGYMPGFDLPNTLSSNLAGYDQGTTYTAWSQVAQQQIGSASSYAWVTNNFDPNTGKLTDTQVKNTAVSSTPYDDTSYGYDPAGNITSETDVRSGVASETQCFAYNTLDQLTQAWTATDSCAADPASNGGSTVGDGITGSAYWTGWGFNALGERTKQTDYSLTGGQNTVTTYSYETAQPDALASTSTTGPSGASSTSYSYNADGATTARDVSSGNQTLSWNDNGTLASDTTISGQTTYVYDAEGGVLLQKDPTQVTLYVFGEQIVLNTGTGAITGTRFLSLPGGGQAVRNGNGSSYGFELTNQQGTGVLTLNSSAQVPGWRQFTPYGAPRGSAPSSWPDANGFLGKAADANSGLTVVGARQYDPATGMFISLDPELDSTDPGQLNGYGYADDNPITRSDPSGKDPIAQMIVTYLATHPSKANNAALAAVNAPPRSYGGGGYTPPWNPFAGWSSMRCPGGFCTPLATGTNVGSIVNSLHPVWQKTFANSRDQTSFWDYVDAYRLAQAEGVSALDASLPAGEGSYSRYLQAAASLKDANTAKDDALRMLKGGQLLTKGAAGLAVIGGTISAYGEWNQTHSIGKSVAVGVADTGINVGATMAGSWAAGAVSDALTGAAIGEVVGPEGALIGAAVGFVVAAGVAVVASNVVNNAVNHVGSAIGHGISDVGKALTSWL